jgi:hypothetical protein
VNRKQRRASGLILPKDPHRNVATHPLIASTAKEFAAACYEQCARASNEWYAKNPSQDEWVEASWGLFVETARSMLAKTLQGNMEQSLKDQVYEAIIADNTVRHGRGIQVRAD